jgi:hypothetical protein
MTTTANTNIVVADDVEYTIGMVPMGEDDVRVFESNCVILTPGKRAVVVRASNYLVVDQDVLGKIRDSGKTSTNRCHLSIRACAPAEVLDFPELLSAIDIVKSGSNTEAFLRAKTEPKKNSMSAKHDAAHMWPLSQPSLAHIKSNMETYKMPADASEAEVKAIKKYFAIESLPDEPAATRAELLALEDKAKWRLGDVSGDDSGNFTSTDEFKKLKVKSCAYTSHEKRKRDYDTVCEELAEAKERLAVYEEQFGEVRKRAHYTQLEVKGSFDMSAVTMQTYGTDNDLALITLKHA